MLRAAAFCACLLAAAGVAAQDAPLARGTQSAAPFAQVDDPSASFEELFAQGLTVGTAMFSILGQSLVLLPPSR